METKTKGESIKARCGYCPRVIFKTDETDGEFKKRDGKIICPVCRATKMSKFSENIAEDKKLYDEKKAEEEKASQEQAKKEVIDVAVASQIKAGKKYMLKKDKQ